MGWRSTAEEEAAAGLLCSFFLLLFCCGWASVSASMPPHHHHEHEHLCESGRALLPWTLRSDQLTVLISGFAESRLPLLSRIVASYSASPFVNAVYILWGNTSTPSPLLHHHLPLSPPVFLHRQPTTSLNLRFLPLPLIRTRSVLICDDDVLLDLPHLRFAFQIWSQHQERIVGFFPRSHEYHLKSRSWIYTVHPDRYSIMLTKSMILATHYLHRYTCHMPPAVRDYVDAHMNCEDIAMNFVVANSSNLGPLLVEGKPRDFGDPRNSKDDLTASALSAKRQHRKERGDCIAEFHRIWGVMPLRYSYGKAIDAVQEQSLCEKHGVLVGCND